MDKIEYKSLQDIPELENARHRLCTEAMNNRSRKSNSCWFDNPIERHGLCSYFFFSAKFAGKLFVEKPL